MRGQLIFNEIIKGDGLNGARRKGRNNSLIAKRNDCLLARYYYYGYYKNKCYEDTIHLLVCEFFLSQNTIIKIITENAGRILALKQKAPSLYYFNYHWPHLRW